MLDDADQSETDELNYYSRPKSRVFLKRRPALNSLVLDLFSITNKITRSSHFESLPVSYTVSSQTDGFIFWKTQTWNAILYRDDVHISLKMRPKSRVFLGLTNLKRNMKLIVVVSRIVTKTIASITVMKHCQVKLSDVHDKELSSKAWFCARSVYATM